MSVITSDYEFPALDAMRHDWTDFRYLLAVVEYGGVGAGARAMGISQPAMSKRISSLEAAISTQILVRKRKGVVLTEAGQLLYARVREMGRAAAAIHLDFAGADPREEGRVRVAAPDGVAAFWLAPRIAAFQRLNPAITISLDAGLWPRDPLRDDIDIAIQYDPSNVGDHVVDKIAKKHYAPFAARSYLDLYGTPDSLESMADHRMIHHSAQTRQKETWDNGVNKLRTKWRADFETNSSAAIVLAVRAGAGIGFMPTSITTMAPELVMIGEAPSASLDLWMIYRKDITRARRARRVIEWIKEIYNPKMNPWHRDEFVHPRDFDAASRSDARSNNCSAKK